MSASADLLRETLSLKGMSPEQLQQALQLIDDELNKTKSDDVARSPATERRGEATKTDEQKKAQTGHGPRAQPNLPVLCGSPESMLEDFTSLAKTGIGGVIVRFRTGPMPAEFSTRALKLFMRDIAPQITEKQLAPA